MEVNSYVQNPDGTQQVIVNKKGISLKLSVVIIISIVLSVIAGAAGILILLKVNPNFARTTFTNITKGEVQVTDKGIADGVNNIYDSVVVVRTYVRDNLIATGTGFIYKQDINNYYLLTNYHVISGGDNVGVQFTNGEEFKVDIVGGDKYADIAVLKYSGSLQLQVAKIGSSEDMRVGDTVFAIGAPLDSEVYSWSVTRGVLSGKDRLVEVSTSNSNTSDWIMRVMQTDAAINSGNSGGPLCNVNGDVIGVTNMKLVNSGVEGMGFAIPVEDAIKYADALVSGEDVSRPYIGISMVDANNRTYASKYGISPRTGVIVESSGAGSPAEKAGLTTGDIIIGINDYEIVSVASLRYTLYKYKAGDTITVKFIRNGSEKTTKLTLVANN